MTGITQSAPMDTVDYDGASPIMNAQIDDTGVKAGMLVQRKSTTYTFGVEKISGIYGNSSDEGYIAQVEIDAIHPQSSTPYDVDTAYSSGDTVRVLHHQFNHAYWLRLASAASITRGSVIIPDSANDGYVADASAFNATASHCHSWIALQDTSNSEWVLAEYTGIRRVYTTTV